MRRFFLATLLLLSVPSPSMAAPAGELITVDVPDVRTTTRYRLANVEIDLLEPGINVRVTGWDNGTNVIIPDTWTTLRIRSSGTTVSGHAVTKNGKPSICPSVTLASVKAANDAGGISGIRTEIAACVQ